MTMNLLMKCKNIEETKRFYRDTLDFNVSDTAEDTCTATKAQGTIVFTSGDMIQGSPNFSGTVYFFLPQVEEYFNTTKDSVEVQWPLQNMSYGTKEFGIKDCNGYHLAFAEKRE
ncbi:MAG TPA: bleomycin resistance family protein [Candidatus Hydrogenedentes bacterium]|nr:bleomycin resistance family protein [Candidatus Hydrogenedentota bacterium]